MASSARSGRAIAIWFVLVLAFWLLFSAGFELPQVEPGLFARLRLLFGWLLASAPALFAWRAGKKLLAVPVDPLTPERVLVFRQQVSQWALTAGMLAWLASGSLIPLAVPLLTLPLAQRRVAEQVLGERWPSAVAFVWQRVRLFWVFYGIAFSILLLPGLVDELGTPRLYTALAVGSAVVGLKLAHRRALFAFFRAEPLSDQSLLAVLEPVWSRSCAPRPELFVSGDGPARFVNALAFPSSTPRVLFGRALIAELPPAQVAAIYGHELAHLEPAERVRIRRIGLGEWALLALAIGAAGVAPPASLTSYWAFLWAVLALFLYAALLGSRARHEGGCDLRAIELCADPEALIDGLIAIHRQQAQPRRTSEEHAAKASHPSLARRIQAIRAHVAHAAPGSEASAPLEPLVLAGGMSGSFVALLADRFVSLEGVPPTAEAPPFERLAASARERLEHRYAELSELRLDPSAGAASLVFRTQDGAARRALLAPLSAEGLAKVQAQLDRADSLLAAPAAKPAKEHVALAHLGGLAIAVVLLLEARIGGALFAFLAVIAPSPSMLFAAACALIATALSPRLAWSSELHIPDLWLPVVVAGLALFSLAAAVRWARTTRALGKHDNAMGIVLALFMLAPTASVLLSSLTGSAEVLHANAAPVTAVAGAAMGWAVLTSALGLPNARWKAPPLFLAGAMILTFGSTAYRTWAVADPFSRAQTLLPQIETPLALIESRDLGGDIQTVELSPDGLSFVARVSAPSGSEPRWWSRHVIGRFGVEAVHTSTSWQAVHFYGNASLLTVESARDELLTTVRLIDSASGAERQHWRVARPFGYKLLASEAQAQIGFWSWPSVLVHLRLDGGVIEQSIGPASRPNLPTLLPSSSGAVLMLGEWPLAWWWSFAMMERSSTILDRVDADGSRRRLLVAPERFGCQVARDGRLFCGSQEPPSRWIELGEDGAVRPLGELGPELRLLAAADERPRAWRADGALVLIDPKAQLARVFHLPDAPGSPYAPIDWTADRIAVGQGSKLTVHRVLAPDRP